MPKHSDALSYGKCHFCKKEPSLAMDIKYDPKKSIYDVYKKLFIADIFVKHGRKKCSWDGMVFCHGCINKYILKVLKMIDHDDRPKCLNCGVQVFKQYP